MRLLSSGGRLRFFSCHFLSFLPFCCSKQKFNAKHVTHKHPTQRSAWSPSPFVCIWMQSTLDAALYLYFTDGGPIPPRTAAHSFCSELKHIMSAPPLLTDCARLCSAAPAVRSGCIAPEGTAPSGVCLLLPSHRFYHPHAPRAPTRRSGPSPPPLTNLRCSTLCF